MWLQFCWGPIGLFLVIPAVFGTRERNIVRGASSSRVLQWLGLISYGIYLWHEAMIDWYLNLTDPVPFASSFWRMTGFMAVVTVASPRRATTSSSGPRCGSRTGASAARGPAVAGRAGAASGATRARGAATRRGCRARVAANALIPFDPRAPGAVDHPRTQSRRCPRDGRAGRVTRR